MSILFQKMTAERCGCDSLNNLVKQMCHDAYAKKNDTALEIEFSAAAEINYAVYEVRDNRVTYVLWAAAALVLRSTIPKMWSLEVALVIVFTWVSSDFYGGITHIVLDHKDVINYKIPDLWRPALEFQWHHLIPHDIVDKPVMCVLGDLNRALPLSIVTALVFGYYYGIDDPIYHFSFTCKLLMAYIGQLSHRFAHCTTTNRPWYAKPFKCLLLRKVQHQMHHKDHGKNFAILNGLANPFLNFLVSLIGLKSVWPYIAILGFLTFLDCHYIAHIFVPAVTSLLL